MEWKSNDGSINDHDSVNYDAGKVLIMMMIKCWRWKVPERLKSGMKLGYFGGKVAHLRYNIYIYNIFICNIYILIKIDLT